MKDSLKIKKKLYEACLLFVNEKQNTVTTSIESNKRALFSETKSSAGDKHETGRAMLQLEMEKASQQLVVINQMKVVLDKINIKNSSVISCLGSLIRTNKETYYLAISAGKITVENTDFYAVSTNSPIGKQLLGKKVGEIIPFNEAKILEIY
ncbi:MAG: 3-oxoacyl-ACP synthase [Lutibacter sp.]|uniref:3-oxoacyl-ACP synthase n=1 Tax=Lutibacter sp. TaxID=1925666 RepID=UPI00385CEBF1